MSQSLKIRPDGALDLVSLGALVHRLDPDIIPFRKATQCRIHVSGGEFNVAANLADCFRLKTGIASAMVDYPIGDLIAERVRAMGVKPFYKIFGTTASTARTWPRSTAIADTACGRRWCSTTARTKPAPFEAGRFQLEGDLRGRRALVPQRRHLLGAFPTTAEAVIEGMQAAKEAGAVVSFDLNYRAKLWNISGGEQRAAEVLGRIVKNVDVLVGNEEDLQKGLGIPGQDVAAKSKLDPSAFFKMIDRWSAASADQSGGHDAARSAFHQPAQLERGGLGRWQDLPGAGWPSWTSTTAWAAAMASRPVSSTAC